MKKEIGTLRAAFGWAIRMKRVAGPNPFSDVRFGRREKPQVDAYTLDETERLLEATAKAPVWVQASVHLAARWGLRSGELASLVMADVDFPRRLVHVRPKEDWVPKSGSARIVPLDDDTAGLLQELSHRDGPLLWGPIEKPLTAIDGDAGFKVLLRAEVRKICHVAGLRVLKKPIHGLRATAFTNARRRHMDPHVIRAIFGHTTDEVGDNHYDATSLEEAARTAGDWTRRPAAAGGAQVTGQKTPETPPFANRGPSTS